MKLADRSRCVEGGVGFAVISGGINCLLWAQKSMQVNISPAKFFFSFFLTSKKLGDLSDLIPWTECAAVVRTTGTEQDDVHFPLSLSFCPRLSFVRGKAETGLNLSLECGVQNQIWARLLPNYSTIRTNRVLQKNLTLYGNRLAPVLKLSRNI